MSTKSWLTHKHITLCDCTQPLLTLIRIKYKPETFTSRERHMFYLILLYHNLTVNKEYIKVLEPSVGSTPYLQ